MVKTNHICNCRNGSISMVIYAASMWQTPIYLGEPIYTKWADFCPYMTPDNKYFFFSRRYSDTIDSGWDGVTKGEIYWVDASIIFRRNK